MSEQESKCETCKDLKGWTEIGGYWMPCPDCQPSATETPSVRELWASGTLYSDKAHTQPALPAVRPLVLASDFTALEKQRDELRTQLAAAQAEVAIYKKDAEIRKDRLAPHSKWLNIAALEIYKADHFGWANTCQWAADAIDAELAKEKPGG